MESVVGQGEDGDEDKDVKGKRWEDSKPEKRRRQKVRGLRYGSPHNIIIIK